MRPKFCAAPHNRTYTSQGTLPIATGWPLTVTLASSWTYKLQFKTYLVSGLDKMGIDHLLQYALVDFDGKHRSVCRVCGECHCSTENEYDKNRGCVNMFMLYLIHGVIDS